MESPKKLHSQIVSHCNKLSELCKSFSVNIESQCDETEFKENARDILTTSKHIVQTVENFLQERPQDMVEKTELQENFVVEYKDNLLENIVKMIRCAKSYFAHRLDIKSQLDFSNARDEVFKFSKSLIDASKSNTLILIHTQHLKLIHKFFC